MFIFELVILKFDRNFFLTEVFVQIWISLQDPALRFSGGPGTCGAYDFHLIFLIFLIKSDPLL